MHLTSCERSPDDRPPPLHPRPFRRLRPGRARGARRRPACRSTSAGRDVALVGEMGSGKSVTALSVMKLLPYPAGASSVRPVMFKGAELLTMPENEIRKVRGNNITIIFQEPMTSLNPLHTIEKQIGEILLLHQGLTGEKARARIVELLGQVGIPDPAGAARQLSASTVRRPAPARDDRHGARQRARPVDRRRADHRARRHRAGANPQAAQGHADAARHVDAVHHPRPRHRAQARRPRLRDEPGQDRRARRRSSACSPRRSILTRANCSPPSRSPIRRRRGRTRRWWSRPRI